MGNERKTFQSFKTYADTEPIIVQLTDEEAGRIFKACYGCYFRGETLEFRPDDDRLFRGAWVTFEMKLLSEQKKDYETSEKRSSAGSLGGKANANRKKQEQANANSEKQEQANVSTYTDTVTGTNSSTSTISSTVTKQEQACTASADRQSASAAAMDAEPPSGDLFSLKQLISTSKRNKVELTSEGINVFYEEMQDSGWILYGEPVEKKFITRALRAWAKYHPEYAPEKETDRNESNERPDTEAQKNIRVRAIKKALEYFPDGKGYPDWGHDIPKYCPREAFTDEEIEVFRSELSIFWEDE